MLSWGLLVPLLHVGHWLPSRPSVSDSSYLYSSCRWFRLAFPEYPGNSNRTSFRGFVFSRVKVRLLSLAVRLPPWPYSLPFQPFYFPGHHSVGVLGQGILLSLGWAKVLGSWDIAPCLWLSWFSHCALNVPVLRLCPPPGMLSPLLAFFRPQLKYVSSLSPSLAAPTPGIISLP